MNSQSRRKASANLLVITTCVVSISLAHLIQAADTSLASDVPLIVVDDMNDRVSFLKPKPPIKTPNMQRLASRGMQFTRAYCATLACNPSRLSTTGVYGNERDWRDAVLQLADEMKAVNKI